MIETWKPIDGLEDYYEVSTTGKVRSKERFIEDKNFSKSGKPFIRKRMFRAKEIKAFKVNDFGHLSVGLFKNGKAKTRPLVHRLVAEAFIPNPNNYPIVDHIDGDPANNRVENLRWADWKHNNRNTPYMRYLISVLESNNIHYKDQYEFECD